MTLSAPHHEPDPEVGDLASPGPDCDSASRSLSQLDPDSVENPTQVGGGDGDLKAALEVEGTAWGTTGRPESCRSHRRDAVLEVPGL